MLTSQIDYASLVEKALLRVVHDVLAMVAEHGLPGRHHVYVTFRTDHPGVAIDEALRARYPNEMTIVLQHEFWGLEVSDDRFAVTLSFNNSPQRLDIPFTAVTVFADPSVEFGLQFTRASVVPASEGGQAPAEPPTAATAHGPDGQGPDTTPAAADESAQGTEAPAAPGAAEAERAGKVVTLDRFRKK